MGAALWEKINEEAWANRSQGGDITAGVPGKRGRIGTRMGSSRDRYISTQPDNGDDGGPD